MTELMTKPAAGPPGADPQVQSVTAFFPCYNDAPTIGRMVEDAHKALERCVTDYEVIVVNDGSQDDSRDVLSVLADRFPTLRVIHHDRNRGYGGALISGFAAATKEWIFYTDGDGQYDATELELLVRAVEADADIDVVQGWKIERGDSWYRKVIGRGYHHAVKLLFNLHVRDTDCDFRLFRRSLLADCPLSSTSGVICVEMMRRFERSGARFVEVPVSHYARQNGRSQFFRLPAITRSALQLASLWWRLMVRRRES